MTGHISRNINTAAARNPLLFEVQVEAGESHNRVALKIAQEISRLAAELNVYGLAATMHESNADPETGFCTKSFVTLTGLGRTSIRFDQIPAGLTINHWSAPMIPSQFNRLDFDRDGQVDALTDGLVLLRFLFGFIGTAVTDGAVSPDCRQCNPEEILPCLEELRIRFDFDGNLTPDALTDGLLLLRHLFGFQGVSLIQDAVGGNCLHCEAGPLVRRMKALGLLPLM
jgi:hypothetical protein